MSFDLLRMAREGLAGELSGAHGMPLGVTRSNYREAEFDLLPGETIFLYRSRLRRHRLIVADTVRASPDRVSTTREVVDASTVR